MMMKMMMMEKQKSLLSFVSQDILRCRVITTSIQHIEFDVPDAGQHVRFR